MQWSSPPPMTIDQNKQYTATIKTSYGDIVLQLFPKDAPVTVNNFVFLARQGFYNGVKFHRVVKGFVIQGGDPTGTGTSGPGYKFADEKITKDYVAGTLAMAMPAPTPTAANSLSRWQTSEVACRKTILSSARSPAASTWYRRLGMCRCRVHRP